MRYRKLQADYLFTGETILDANHVLIIDETGAVVGIETATSAGPDVTIYNGMLSPGFINCHCHLELSHMQGLIPQKTGLVAFILGILQLRNFPETQILAAIASAESAMCNNGIVAVGDISNNTLTLPQKLLGNLYYHNFVEVSGFSPQIAATRFAAAQAVYNNFATHFATQTSLVPHAPYSVSAQLFALINGASGGAITSMHNQECPDENEFFFTGGGSFNQLYNTLQINHKQFHQPTHQSSLQSVLPQLNNPSQIVLVHNTFTNQSDLHFLANSATQPYFFCLCVKANQYIENALPPIALLRQNNAKIVLGTDSLASNNTLCILEEIKTISANFPDIPTAELLHWATLQGAKALHINHLYGSFEPGKKPGVLLINHLSPTGSIAPTSSVTVLVKSNASPKTNN